MSLILIHAILWAASLTLIGVCAGIDLSHRLIPNEIVIAVAAIGLALGVISRPDTIWLSLLTAFAVFCGLALLAYHKFMGGGDMKLIAAVTLLVRPERAGVILLEIALAGGVLSCIYLAARWALKNQRLSGVGPADVAPPSSGLAKMIEIECSRIAAGGPMPYALAVLGGVASYTARELLQCIYGTSCSL